MPDSPKILQELNDLQQQVEHIDKHLYISRVIIIGGILIIIVLLSVIVAML